MQHKGVRYSLSLLEPSLWKWQFEIGGMITTGKAHASLQLLAERRIKMRIDRALRDRDRANQLAAE